MLYTIEYLIQDEDGVYTDLRKYPGFEAPVLSDYNALLKLAQLFLDVSLRVDHATVTSVEEELECCPLCGGQLCECSVCHYCDDSDWC